MLHRVVHSMFDAEQQCPKLEVFHIVCVPNYMQFYFNGQSTSKKHCVLFYCGISTYAKNLLFVRILLAFQTGYIIVSCCRLLSDYRLNCQQWLIAPVFRRWAHKRWKGAYSDADVKRWTPQVRIGGMKACSGVWSLLWALYSTIRQELN